MAAKFSGKRQYSHVINVLDKINRFSNSGWVDGKVVEIKEKRSGRQRVLVSTYVLKFDDMPSTRLERDFEATSELVDFTYQRKHGKEAITPANWNLLGIVGVNLLTKWTLELNLVAGGATPPQWLVAIDPVFIRKCCIQKFHTALQQFELLYTCGYSRFVGLPAMIELLNTHHIYCKSDNLKIRLAVQNAENEWNAKHHPEDLATVQKGAAIDTGNTAGNARTDRAKKRSGIIAACSSRAKGTKEVSTEESRTAGLPEAAKDGADAQEGSSTAGPTENAKESHAEKEGSTSAGPTEDAKASDDGKEGSSSAGLPEAAKDGADAKKGTCSSGPNEDAMESDAAKEGSNSASLTEDAKESEDDAKESDDGKEGSRTAGLPEAAKEAAKEIRSLTEDAKESEDDAKDSDDGKEGSRTAGLPEAAKEGADGKKGCSTAGPTEDAKESDNAKEGSSSAGPTENAKDSDDATEVSRTAGLATDVRTSLRTESEDDVTGSCDDPDNSDAQGMTAGATPVSPATPPPWATPEMMALFLSHMNALTQNQQSVKPEGGSKRKVTDKKPRISKKQRNTVNCSSDNNDDEWFTGTTSENSHRRLNWQKGRQDWSRPSKIKAEIEKVTVDTLPEIYPNLRKHGWAILRDCTAALSPKARFTREQRDYIHQCTSYFLYNVLKVYIHNILLYFQLIPS
jgi:hypothetical protein